MCGSATASPSYGERVDLLHRASGGADQRIEAGVDERVAPPRREPRRASLPSHLGPSSVLFIRHPYGLPTWRPTVGTSACDGRASFAIRSSGGRPPVGADQLRPPPGLRGRHCLHPRTALTGTPRRARGGSRALSARTAQRSSRPPAPRGRRAAGLFLRLGLAAALAEAPARSGAPVVEHAGMAEALELLGGETSTSR